MVQKRLQFVGCLPPAICRACSMVTCRTVKNYHGRYYCLYAQSHEFLTILLPTANHNAVRMSTKVGSLAGKAKYRVTNQLLTGDAQVVTFKGCPRCHGDIVLEGDRHGAYEECLQCGYVRELESRISGDVGLQQRIDRGPALRFQDRVEVGEENSYHLVETSWDDDAPEPWPHDGFPVAPGTACQQK